MPARPSGLSWMPCAAVIAAALPLLSGCGTVRNKFPPPCPSSVILGDASDFDSYRSSGTGAAHRDFTDLVLHGRIVWIQGSCQEGDRKNQIAVSTSVGVELTRGPAMQGRTAVVPVFVALVTGGDKILDKQVYLMNVEFPSNIDRITMTPGQLSLVLPVSATTSGTDYTIVAGFQLTPDQVMQSRQNRAP